jgi:hypothetical protein
VFVGRGVKRSFLLSREWRKVFLNALMQKRAMQRKMRGLFLITSAWHTINLPRSFYLLPK